ncbi:hypothetical protein [Schlesneria paludicola]|nr:hypothetical protein [Schlesneria paludicola]
MLFHLFLDLAALMGVLAVFAIAEKCWEHMRSKSDQYAATKD